MVGEMATAGGFTQLEIQVLGAFAGSQGECEALVREQIASATVRERENTVVGFYTHISIDPGTCRPHPDLGSLAGQWTRGGGGHLEVDGFEHGLGFVLWFEGGYLDCIEGFTYGDLGKMPEELSELRLTAVELT